MFSLSLTEQFFLLSFDIRKRVFANWYYTEKFDYGLCGAFLFELILSKRLIFTEDKELIEDKSVSLNKTWVDALLSEVEKNLWFTILFGKNHQKTLINWFKVLNAHISHIKDATKLHLSSEKIIGKKSSKVFGVKLYSSTYLEDISMLQSLKQDLWQIILGAKKPDVQHLMLLRLIKGLKITKDIFLEKIISEQKDVEQKLNQLFEQEEITRTLQYLFLEVRGQEKWDSILDSLDVISEAMETIGESVDGIGEGGDSGSDGGGDGGGD